MKPWIAAAVLLLAGGGALLWYVLDPADPGAGAGGFHPPPPSVEITRVQTGSVVRSVEAVGSLRANEAITVRPEFAGRISRIHFDEGQPVKAGAMLITLDDSVYAAEVEEKAADLRLAELEFRRADELVSKRAAPVEARDRALLNMQAVDAARKLAEARLDKMRLRAPFDGVVGLRLVSEGDFVNVGQDLVSLVEIDPLKVDFRVGEVFLADVSPGQTIEVKVDAFPDETFEGEVYAIEPQVDINGRALVIRAKLPNPDQKLRPGLFSRVDLIVDAAAQSLLVPEDAIVPRGDQHFVYRVVDGHALLTEVVLGKRERTRVEIRRGLSLDDVVVTAGQLKLRDGVAVTPVAPSDAMAGGTGAREEGHGS